MKAGCEQLRFSRFVPRDRCYHVARQAYASGRRCRMHRHDFAEVFWVERGRGWHGLEGGRERIETGDLVLIRPRDAHGFGVSRGETFTMVNVAFAAPVLEHLRRRYFGPARRWLWSEGSRPAKLRIAPEEIARLSAQADQLATAHPQRRLDLEAFLLNLLQVATRAHAPDDERPVWLREALADLARHPERLAEGPRALASTAGRSLEHLNRTLVKHAGKTTTELINDLRLDRSAAKLRMSTQSILDVALDCGFGNLGYFYRCFKARYGMTPRAYRLTGPLTLTDG
jgi:AraC family cel operon transcriptional repressor